MIKGFVIFVLDAAVSYSASEVVKAIFGQQSPAIILVIFFLVGGLLAIILKDERELILTWPLHRFRFLFDLKNSYKQGLENEIRKHISKQQFLENKSWIDLQVDERKGDFVEYLYNRVLNEKKTKRILILGEAGSGKSFALLKTAYALVQFSIYQLGIGVPIPILIECDKYKGSLLTILQGKLSIISEGESGNLLKKGADKLLRRGRIVLLLDALDETSSEHKQTFLHEIDDWATAGAYRKTSIIITARSRDVDVSRFEKMGFEIGEVQEVSRNSIKNFIEMYKSKEQNVAEILSSLDKFDLLTTNAIGRSPFWLSLMVEKNIFDKERVIVLDKSVSELLEKEWGKHQEKLRWNKKSPMEAQVIETRQALSLIAYEMTLVGKWSLEFEELKPKITTWLEKNKIVDMTAFDVIGFAQDSKLLDSSTLPGDTSFLIRFRHSLIKDFFAACYLLTGPKLLDSTHIMTYINDPQKWWTPLLMCINLLQSDDSRRHNENKAKTILNEIASSGDTKAVFLVALSLSPIDKYLNKELFSKMLEQLNQILDKEVSEEVMEVIDWGLKIAPNELISRFSELVENSFSPTHLRKVVLYIVQNAVKTGTRTRSLMLLFEAWRLKELVTDCFIEVGNDAVPILIDEINAHLPNASKEFYRLVGIVKALAAIKDKRATTTLCRLLKVAPSIYRENVVDALAEIGDPSAISSLVEMIELHGDDPHNYFLKRNIYFAFSKMGELGLKALMTELESDETSYATIHGVDKVLAEVGVSGVELLRNGLKSKKSSVQEVSMKALSLMREKSAINDIADLINHPNIMLGTDAAKSLARYGVHGVPYLLAALSDDRNVAHAFLNSYIVDALVEIGKAATRDLILALESPHEYVSKHAAIALGKIGDLEAKDILIQKMSMDSEFGRRLEFGKALGMLASKDETIDAWLVNFYNNKKDWRYKLPPLMGLLVCQNDSAMKIVLHLIKDGFGFEDPKVGNSFRVITCGELPDVLEDQNIDTTEIINAMNSFVTELQLSSDKQDKGFIKIVNNVIDQIKSRKEIATESGEEQTP